MSPFTQMELLSYGLNNMNVNFNIFLGQKNHRILNIIEPLWSVLETREEQIPASNISQGT
jgi:hypothetical protein